MQASSPTRCCTCKFQKWLKSGLKYQNIMNWRPSKTHFNSTSGDLCRLQTVGILTLRTAILEWSLRKVGILTK